MKMKGLVGLVVLSAILLRTEGSTVVNLYYETLCPDCIHFMRTQLCPAWEKIGSYFLIEFVPYGNARTTKDATGNVSIQCQHGVDECKGNIMHGCALKHLPTNSTTEFICCTMRARNPPTAGPKCARKLGLDFTSVKKCARSEEGLGLLELNGEKTEKLQPSHKFVPWILFNRKYDAHDMEIAQNHFLSVLCKYIQPPPSVCNEI